MATEGSKTYENVAACCTRKLSHGDGFADMVRVHAGDKRLQKGASVYLPAKVLRACANEVTVGTKLTLTVRWNRERSNFRATRASLARPITRAPSIAVISAQTPKHTVGIAKLGPASKPTLPEAEPRVTRTKSPTRAPARSDMHMSASATVLPAKVPYTWPLYSDTEPSPHKESGRGTQLNYSSEMTSKTVAPQHALSSSQTTYVWECCLERDSWIAFDIDIAKELEYALKCARHEVVFRRKGIPYIADLDRMTQQRIDGLYSTVRKIRRYVVIPPTPDHTSTKKDETLSWATNAIVVGTEARLYKLQAENIGSKVSRETDEFNKACAQFSRLCNAKRNTVIQVDVYESEATRRAFEATKSQFKQLGKSTAEVWVFHGTKDRNIDSIMTTGFKVGGRDPGVPVANGSSYGKGVYTATGPASPMSYSQAGKVILARALKGGGSDSWEVREDWVIFKDGSQLLPVYVVHYTRDEPSCVVM